MLWFKIKQNSTSPVLRLTVTDANDDPVSFAGATAVFSMRLQTEATLLIDEAAATIVAPATSGVVTYAFTAEQTADIGLYVGEFKITLADLSVLRVPTSGYVGVRIYAEISTLEEVEEQAYATSDEADLYFDTRINTTTWDDATETNKVKALAHATRLIERLNFKGTRVTTTQTFQFPRGTDTAIPQDIKNACFELALALLDGVDSEKEFESLSMDQADLDGIKTVYNRKALPAHILAGIVSVEAWRYLLPYLRNPNEFSISRI